MSKTDATQSHSMPVGDKSASAAFLGLMDDISNFRRLSAGLFEAIQSINPNEVSPDTFRSLGKLGLDLADCFEDIVEENQRVLQQHFQTQVG